MGAYKEAYQHVVRLGDQTVEGILYGKVYIFPKIDGTNGVIWTEDEVLKCGSRRRILDLENEKDNAGFAEAITKDENFIAFSKAYPHLIVYGEWLVPHTIKNYRDDAWRKFYVFDVAYLAEDNHVKYLSYDEYSEILNKFNIEYLAPLKIITNPSMEDIYYTAENNFYLMKDGEVGEGVVCKNYDFVSRRAGEAIWAKYVRAEFKENFHKTMGAPELIKHPIEEMIVEKFCTEAFVQKEFHKLLEEVEWNMKLTPRLFNTIWHELIEEEMWNILKEFKNPSIDFKMLNRLVQNKIKRSLPEIY